MNIYTIPKSEKEAIYQQISNTTGMSAFAAEKDWWMMQTLSVIFEMEVARLSATQDANRNRVQVPDGALFYSNFHIIGR